MMFRIGLQYVSPLLLKPSHLLSNSTSSSICNASRLGVPSLTFLPSPTSSSSPLHLLPPSLRHFHTSNSPSPSPSHRSRPSSSILSSSSPFSSFHHSGQPRAQPSPSSPSSIQRRFLSSEDTKLPKGSKVDVYVRPRGAELRFTPPRAARQMPFNGSYQDVKAAWAKMPWSIRPILVLCVANLSAFLMMYLINAIELAGKHSKMPLDQFESHLSNEEWISNMLVSWKGLTEFKVWSLLISGVCHDYASKLFMDLVFMQLAGPPVLLAMGAYTPFIALVGASSILGNLAAAVTMKIKGEPEARIPGGQAPVAGVVTYLTLMAGSSTVAIGSLAFKAWALPICLFGSVMFGDYAGGRDFVNGQTSAQWGGAAAGVLFFVVKKALRLPF